MISNRRQILPFFVVLVMVVSVFAFIPAKAEASLTATLEGRNGNYSFASVNGSADYTVTITNDGDIDFEMVTISASFLDDTWYSENVTFTSGGVTENGTMSVGSLAADTMVQVHVSATVGQGAKVDFAEVPMKLSIDADGTSLDLEAIVCVTNWIAYESTFPSQPAVNTYDMGDEFSYQIKVENIAVTKNVDGTTAPMPTDDIISIAKMSTAGWRISSDDEGWDPMFEKGVLNGMDASRIHTWNIAVISVSLSFTFRLSINRSHVF